MTYRIVNGLGDQIESPSEAQMRTFLEALDTSDEEHGAAWLETDDEVALEWSGTGRLVLSVFAEDDDKHLTGVSRERAVELWLALARGGLEAIAKLPWAPGNGSLVHR